MSVQLNYPLSQHSPDKNQQASPNLLENVDSSAFSHYLSTSSMNVEQIIK